MFNGGESNACSNPIYVAGEMFLRQYQIVAMHPGCNETRIVTKINVQIWNFNHVWVYDKVFWAACND